MRTKDYIVCFLLIVSIILSSISLVKAKVIEGPQGIQGVQGEKGEQGIQGEKGEDGVDGINGTDGKDGENGAVGAQGEKGEKGDKGDKGEKGDIGLTGASGSNGANGKDGINGKDGDDGKDGIGITSTYINESGHLIITYSSGLSTDLGRVVGRDGYITTQGKVGYYPTEWVDASKDTVPGGNPSLCQASVTKYRRLSDTIYEAVVESHNSNSTCIYNDTHGNYDYPSPIYFSVDDITLTCYYDSSVGQWLNRAYISVKRQLNAQNLADMQSYEELIDPATFISTTSYNSYYQEYYDYKSNFTMQWSCWTPAQDSSREILTSGEYSYQGFNINAHMGS